MTADEQQVVPLGGGGLLVLVVGHQVPQGGHLDPLLGLAMVPGEHRETPLSGRGKYGSDFFVVDISLIFSEICYSIKQQNYLFT